MLCSVMNNSKDSIVSINEKLPVFPITNQFLIELYDAKEELNAVWANFRNWPIHLCDLKDIKIDHTTLLSSVLKIKEKMFYCNQHQKRKNYKYL